MGTTKVLVLTYKTQATTPKVKAPMGSRGKCSKPKIKEDVIIPLIMPHFFVSLVKISPLKTISSINGAKITTRMNEPIKDWLKGIKNIS